MTLKRVADSDISERSSKRMHFENGPFLEEIICEIAGHLFAQHCFKELWACDHVNKHWKHAIEQFKNTLDPIETLSFDACDGLENDTRPPPNIFYLTEKIQAYAQESLLGCSLLNMPKNLTLAHLEKVALSQEIYLEYDDESLCTFLNTHKIDQPYQVLHTNNIFPATRNMQFNNAKRFLEKKGWILPNPLESIALCILAFIKHQKLLYGMVSGLSMGYTNTCCKDSHVVIGLFFNALVIKGKDKGKYRKVLHIMLRSYEASDNLGAAGCIRM